MNYKRLTYKLDEPIKTKYLDYKYMRIADYDIYRDNYGRITDDMLYNKLGEIEDKIEQETLIELPCKVGDTVYAIVRKGDISSGKYIVKPFIEKGKVRGIMVGSCGFNIYTYFENIGYLGIHEESEVFLTREEAEKRLEELQK